MELDKWLVIQVSSTVIQQQDLLQLLVLNSTLMLSVQLWTTGKWSAGKDLMKIHFKKHKYILN